MDESVVRPSAGKVKEKPVDYLRIPIFMTYLASAGVRAEQFMFDNHNIVILRFVGSDGRQHDIFVVKPSKFEDDHNYYDLKRKDWCIQ